MTKGKMERRGRKEQKKDRDRACGEWKETEKKEKLEEEREGRMGKVE